MHPPLLEDLLLFDAAASLAAGRDTHWFVDEMRRVEAARRARGDPRPLRVLVDLRGVPERTEPSRRVVYERHAELEAHRIAVLGASRFQEFLTNFLITATGHRGAHYFTDEARAKAWLAEAPG